MTSRGRAIDPKPVCSLLLERRSVIITRGALYKEHLHSIEGVTEDLIAPAVPNVGGGEGNNVGGGVAIDNWDLISDEKMKTVVTHGGRITRETRVSLTCRDVEKVRKPLLGKGLGK